jgi:hypothetical protein
VCATEHVIEVVISIDMQASKAIDIARATHTATIRRCQSRVCSYKSVFICNRLFGGQCWRSTPSSDRQVSDQHLQAQPLRVSCGLLLATAPVWCSAVAQPTRKHTGIPSPSNYESRTRLCLRYGYHCATQCTERGPQKTRMDGVGYSAAPPPPPHHHAPKSTANESKKEATLTLNHAKRRISEECTLSRQPPLLTPTHTMSARARRQTSEGKLTSWPSAPCS